ncbi:hypothetical protein ACUUL3_05030 [Thiovibrio sp. JS02]
MEILEERRLANGLTVTVYDRSKKIAGDRWLVKILCEAKFPVDDDFFARPAEPDRQLLAEVRARMAGVVTFAVVKERNFIDDAEREPTLNAMVEQVAANMVEYFANPKFPEKLFFRKYEELRQACLIERHYRRGAVVPEDDEGPADFSACFRD